jgi:hypothetical protein
VQCGPSGSGNFSATASTGPLSSPVDSTVGTHTVTVLAQDAVNNQSQSGPLSYTVAQATPVITWPTPMAITQGTPLGLAQLDATANVAGVFFYSPPAGTVLAAGTQTLSVVFTPTDTVDYTQAHASVSLVVNPAQAQISLSPSAINFGNVVFGSLLTQTETVTNSGSSKLILSKISIALGAGSDRDDFAFLTTCLFPMPPGASCKIFVYFLADDLGSHAATLVITDNATGSPQKVPISANVVKKSK